MAKEKIDVKNVYLTEEEGVLKIKGFEDEEVPFKNLSKKMQDMIRLQKPLDIKMKTHSNRKPPQRKPTYKFKCDGCNAIIKTNNKNLNIKCMDCDKIFKIMEK